MTVLDGLAATSTDNPSQVLAFASVGGGRAEPWTMDINSAQLWFGQDGTIVELVQPVPDASHRPSPARLVAMAVALHAAPILLGDPNAAYVGNVPAAP